MQGQINDRMTVERVGLMLPDPSRSSLVTVTDGTCHSHGEFLQCHYADGGGLYTDELFIDLAQLDRSTRRSSIASK